MTRWWRAYDDALDDPKVQKLPDALFKTWFNLLCLASRNGGVLPSAADTAFALRLTEAETSKRLQSLVTSGLLDDDAGTLRPHNWNARQFVSDGSTERVKRFRERRRNVSSPVAETANGTGPDTETEHSKELPAVVPKKSSTRGFRLPVDWQPSGANRSFASEALGDRRAWDELAKFRDFWIAKPGAAGVKLDWEATWRNWVRSAAERMPGARAGPVKTNSYLGALADLQSEADRGRDDRSELDPVALYDLELTATRT